MDQLLSLFPDDERRRLTRIYRHRRPSGDDERKNRREQERERRVREDLDLIDRSLRSIRFYLGMPESKEGGGDADEHHAGEPD